MNDRKCLILTQYRTGSDYNDFIGKFYHFPIKKNKNYFQSLPIEFVYFEPQKRGDGVFFGYGRIEKTPFPDQREPDHLFVEIADYKPFSSPVPFKNAEGEILESLYNKEFYDPQNSVRRIRPEFLDELCLDGSIELNFKADAHLIQVLGEQLIASERVGILELVKNAFDAGAAFCNVRIENIPNLERVPKSLYQFNDYEGPVIVVEDDGTGMSKDQIELGWLRPASTIKTNVKERIKAEKEKAALENRLGTFNALIRTIKANNKGRIPLGEKGVGRFACHRLGRKLIIKTKVAENPYEYVLSVNWDDFNVIDGKIRDLSSVPISLTRQNVSRTYGNKRSGTQLIIYGGRTGFELTENEIKEINRTLLKLNSPNPHPARSKNRFKVTFEAPQVKHLDKSIIDEDYSPVFTIAGTVNESGILTYEYSFMPPSNIPLAPVKKLEGQIDLKTIERKDWLIGSKAEKAWRVPECGPFFIHLDVWIRNSPWIGNSIDDKAFKEYLENYGGISIYRDGLNIFPAEWGAETDWLGLRQRQIKQARRISYYHMIGNVEIDQSVNVGLIDKTNREGLINNRSFTDLKMLTKAVTHFIENEYMGKRDALKNVSGEFVRDPRVLGKFSKQAASILTNISSSEYDTAADPYSFFERIADLGVANDRKGKLVEISRSLENLEQNLKEIKGIQDMLTEQAGFGLGIAVALHEVNKTTSNFYYGIVDLIKRRKLDPKLLEELKDNALVLESEITRLAPLRALRNEEDVPFKISRSVEYVHSVFKRRFRNLSISFSTSKNHDFEIVAKYGLLNQIFTNLFDNACYWLDDPDNPHREIRVEIDEKSRRVIVADSGPGLSDSILPYLFQPGYSLKFPPSGLGLYICRYYMNSLKKRGDIYLVPENDRLSGLQGAQFLLDFSKVMEPKNE